MVWLWKQHIVHNEDSMFLTSIDLDTRDLAQARAFYTEILGLPLRQTTADAFTAQAGTTALTFRAAGPPPPLYHFAFTVPFNKWRQAKAWLKARTTLLEGEGQDEFESARVRSHSYYFPDPAGNILEFIAREDLPTKVGEGFGPEDVLHISEIGLVVDEVPNVVRQLKTRLGIEVYRDSSFEDFAQLGDINGVLVLAQRGRLWAPDERQPAVVSPVRIRLLGTLTQQITLEPYPYVLEVVSLGWLAEHSRTMTVRRRGPRRC
jgi:catechol 2,3-dioxygenase-like lactoylglutathione lyase family enzyme